MYIVIKTYATFFFHRQLSGHFCTTNSATFFLSHSTTAILTNHDLSFKTYLINYEMNNSTLQSNNIVGDKQDLVVWKNRKEFSRTRLPPPPPNYLRLWLKQYLISIQCWLFQTNLLRQLLTVSLTGRSNGLRLSRFDLDPLDVCFRHAWDLALDKDNNVSQIFVATLLLGGRDQIIVPCWKNNDVVVFSLKIIIVRRRQSYGSCRKIIMLLSLYRHKIIMLTFRHDVEIIIVRLWKWHYYHWLEIII